MDEEDRKLLMCFIALVQKEMDALDECDSDECPNGCTVNYDMRAVALSVLLSAVAREVN